MNKAIEDSAKALNQYILDEPVVKEYKRYKAIIEAHPEYLKQEETLKAYQKKIIQNKDKGLDTASLEEEYKQKMNQFISNPVINNYMVLKEEVNALLITINQTINQYLQDK